MDLMSFVHCSETTLICLIEYSNVYISLLHVYIQYPNIYF